MIRGTKTWITNARFANPLPVLVKTDPDAEPRHRGMSVLMVEAGTPGYEVLRDLGKLGYKGPESCEVVLDDARVPADNLLGGQEGLGFKQVMSGLEVGRINIAARGVGVTQAALDASLAYSQQREAFGQPIGEFQAIQLKLADMATELEAARLLTRWAAHRIDQGLRADVEAGMAKYFASGGGYQGVAGVDADPWQLRVLHRDGGRAALPRRSADGHRRGHQRDPAHHHRQGPAAAGPRAGMTAAASIAQIDLVSDERAAAFEADGFVAVDSLIDTSLIDPLRDRFERLFRGDFETGTAPDEVNWREGHSDPTLTRQICNGWKADRLIASVVLDARLGAAVARLAGWPGTRIAQDNVLWKPPGARSLGFHRDNAYLAWYTPTEMFSCWIALDDTTADGGTLEIARGSHRLAHGSGSDGRVPRPRGLPGPGDRGRAACPDRRTRHRGDGGVCRRRGRSITDGPGTARAPTAQARHRRSLVLHCASSEPRFNRAGFGEGNGPVYSRYARLADDEMDENHFPGSCGGPTATGPPASRARLVRRTAVGLNT